MNNINMKTKFRKDINGLRAIAVIAVVIFHFNADWLPGGFAGVDVFFVISGFLMTSIIFRGLEQGNFSILKFYVSRANRIIPALAILCLVLIVFGWFYLTPLDYQLLGKHVSSSIGFISNIVYWSESGYFDASSNEKWLLHTWSLSVEWQFYIIFPAVLVVLSKFLFFKTIKALVLFGTVLGFIFCVFATYKWPDPAYYLLPTRAWEMMIGGVVYFYPITLRGKSKKLLELLGLSLIISSYVFISKENLWPGYLAIIPVLGAVLIILAHQNDSIVTGNPIFQKLGTWSYSIYLWHWPIVVSIYYFDLPFEFIYFGFILSILFGFLSYRFIERIVFINDFTENISYFRCKPISLFLIVCFLGAIVYFSQGFIFHYSKSVQVASLEALNSNKTTMNPLDKFDRPPFVLGDSDNIKFIVVGDSHAGAITSAVAESIDLSTEGVISFARASCPFIIDMDVYMKVLVKCSKSTSHTMITIDKYYPDIPVIWVGRFSARIFNFDRPIPLNVKAVEPVDKVIIIPKEADYFDYISSQFEKTICTINSTNPTYILSPIPEMQINVPKFISKQLMMNKNVIDVSSSLESHLRINEFVNQLYLNTAVKCGATILNVNSFLCDDSDCFGSVANRPIYIDQDHLSEFGNKLLVPLFKEINNM